ncbi:hypothetical protein PACTADRAFT_47620 [Pachysolen tannophilus NRRL Y-2460]|uniref:Retrograde transport protein Dsl1 C-terminal domain-containing protein n=1 Tax=Pachysolen tannophilus NRRL Y-2460 TaxID=669874 RepID=A0A1E4U190_PACTA|nr:hypothetical protein PACTADRAFT_47620 [Pachysolen tannophilus NRRL Y-2460]
MSIDLENLSQDQLSNPILLTKQINQKLNSLISDLTREFKDEDDLMLSIEQDPNLISNKEKQSQYNRVDVKSLHDLNSLNDELIRNLDLSNKLWVLKGFIDQLFEDLSMNEFESILFNLNKFKLKLNDLITELSDEDDEIVIISKFQAQLSNFETELYSKLKFFVNNNYFNFDEQSLVFKNMVDLNDYSQLEYAEIVDVLTSKKEYKEYSDLLNINSKIDNLILQPFISNDHFCQLIYEKTISKDDLESYQISLTIKKLETTKFGPIKYCHSLLNLINFINDLTFSFKNSKLEKSLKNYLVKSILNDLKEKIFNENIEILINNEKDILNILQEISSKMDQSNWFNNQINNELSSWLNNLLDYWLNKKISDYTITLKKFLVGDLSTVNSLVNEIIEHDEKQSSHQVIKTKNQKEIQANETKVEEEKEEEDIDDWNWGNDDEDNENDEIDTSKKSFTAKETDETISKNVNTYSNEEENDWEAWDNDDLFEEDGNAIGDTNKKETLATVSTNSYKITGIPAYIYDNFVESYLNSSINLSPLSTVIKKNTDLKKLLISKLDHVVANYFIICSRINYGESFQSDSIYKSKVLFYNDFSYLLELMESKEKNYASDLRIVLSSLQDLNENSMNLIIENYNLQLENALNSCDFEDELDKNDEAEFIKNLRKIFKEELFDQLLNNESQYNKELVVRKMLNDKILPNFYNHLYKKILDLKVISELNSEIFSNIVLELIQLLPHNLEMLNPLLVKILEKLKILSSFLTSNLSNLENMFNNGDLYAFNNEELFKLINALFVDSEKKSEFFNYIQEVRYEE